MAMRKDFFDDDWDNDDWDDDWMGDTIFHAEKISLSEVPLEFRSKAHTINDGEMTRQDLIESIRELRESIFELQKELNRMMGVIYSFKDL